MMNDEPNFSNISGQNSAPTVAQPAHHGNASTVKFNRGYLLSLQGILRFLIIIFQFAGWVSAAAVPVLISGQYFMPTDYAQTRSAYLFFSIVGFLFGIIFFLVYLFNIVNLNKINKIPWNLILLITDVMWVISTLILAIVCAVKEGQIKEVPNLEYLNKGLLNVGAFGSAAFFGFLLTIIYAVLAAIGIIRIVKSGTSTPAYTP